MWDGTYVEEFPNGGGTYSSNVLSRTTNPINVVAGSTYTIIGVNRLRIDWFAGTTWLSSENADANLPSIDRVAPATATKVRLYYQYDYTGSNVPSVKLK